MARKPKAWKTVAKGVYERNASSDEPYFLVRVRLKGVKNVNKTFPYLPRHLANTTGQTEKYKTREAAMTAAIAFAAAEKSTFHFYGKPSEHVAQEHTLRDWLKAWVREACDLEDADGNPLPNLTPRLGADKDKQQVLRYIQMADAYAKRHTRASVMDRKVVDLTRADFNGPHGMLGMLTGRKVKGSDIRPPASHGTQRRFLAMMNTVWSHARDYWDMDLKRPFEGVVVSATERKKKVGRVLYLHELHAVEKALGEVATPVLAAIYFLRWTAARSGEMRKLRWENINWPDRKNHLKRPQVTFLGTKTPKKGAYRERTIDLVEGAIEALQMLYDKKKGPPKTGLVFHSPKDPTKPLPEKTAYQAFVRALKRAHVPHARLHDLRHSRTTEISSSIPKAQAMEITGHSDDRTFAIYTHLAEDTMDKVEQADLARRQAKKPSKKINWKDAVRDLTTEERLSLIAELAKSTG